MFHRAWACRTRHCARRARSPIDSAKASAFCASLDARDPSLEVRVELEREVSCLSLTIERVDGRIVELLPRPVGGRHMTDDQLILLAVRPIFRAPTEGDRAPSSRTDRPGGVDGTHATVSSSLGNHARRWCGADSHGLLECGRRGFLRGCLDAGSPHAARLRATEVW